MSLLNYSIKNMIGGVSQQPASVRLPNQCDEMINCIPSVTDFLKRRPGAEGIGGLAESLPPNAFIDFIRRGDKEAGLLIIRDATASVYDLSGRLLGTAASDYFRCDSPRDDLKLLTIKDYNFILNTKKEVCSGPGSDNYWDINYYGLSAMGLVFVKQAAYNTKYSITINGKLYSYKTPKDDSNGAFQLSTENVANTLARYMQEGRTEDSYYICSVHGESHGQYPNPGECSANTGTAEAPRTCGNKLVLVSKADNSLENIEVIQYKNIIFLRNKILDGKPLNFSVDDGMAGSYIKNFTDTAKSVTELPTRAVGDYVIKIVGDPSNKSDDYYVKFVREDSSRQISDGYWKECPKKDNYEYLMADTMPVALTVTENGVGIAGLKWERQKAGDETSCPLPSFVNKTIGDIFFYNNRLCFLTEDTVCMSEAGEYFNFFNTTATALLDSDPIDVAVSSTKVSPLRYAVPYNEGLFLYSDTTLFVAEHGDVLSAANISIRPIIQFDTELTARPVVADTSIFYTTARGGYTAMREYRPDSSGDMYGYSNDITAHVPAYIPAGIRKLTVSMEESMLFALTGNDGIYVYNYQNGSNQERVQSAWGKWVFRGRVLNAEVINGALYMAVSYAEMGGPVHLEKITLNGGDGNLTDRLEDFTSSYTYSTQYIRRDASYPTITAGRTQLRTLTVKYADSGPFKIIIERRGRKPEERTIIPPAPSGEARVAILARNEDVNIRIESIGANQFKLIESRFEAVFTARSKLL